MDAVRAGERAHRHRSAWPTERRAAECVRRNRPTRDGRMRCNEGGDARRACAQCVRARRDAEQRGCATCPAAQRGPARRPGRSDASCCAGTVTHSRRRQLLVGPECQRPSDRTQRVAIPSRNPTRHHDQDGPAGATAVAPGGNLHCFRRGTRDGRAFQPALTQAVAHDLQRPARLTARDQTRRAVAGPDRGARGPRPCPGLDVCFAMDDS